MTVLRCDDAPSFVTYGSIRIREPLDLSRLAPQQAPGHRRMSLRVRLAPSPWLLVKGPPSGLNSYRERIATLREHGQADGVTLRAESEAAFFDFIKANAYARKASLVLLDNGNLRAVWKDDDGGHVGVQFHGGRVASYVIFRRRDHGAAVSRVAGKDTLDGVRKQIRAFGLDGLVSG